MVRVDLRLRQIESLHVGPRLAILGAKSETDGHILGVQTRRLGNPHLCAIASFRAVPRGSSWLHKERKLVVVPWNTVACDNCQYYSTPTINVYRIQ